MENPPHSLPKKSYRGNGFAGKSVYDDVFGGRPKFGVPTLSPRVEDYSEIFEGFHASRGSSIPVIDLPAVEDEASDLFFDVRSSGFDYSEVFGSFNGSDFAVSYDELFKQSKAGDESSDEAWTPAQSDSLSDESDPSGCSEKNQSLSSADLHNSCYDGKQFNISYHKANAKGKEDNGVTHVTQLDAIPGYSFTINKTLPSQYVEDESSYLQIERDTNFGVLKEDKQIRKTVSRPPISDLDLQDYETEPNPLAGNEKSSSPGKAFISVSDVSLRTRPSRLPPPSRPPPAFADENENSSRLNSKLKASKGYVIEKTKADYSPPYFDVEVDASSSAAASAAAMKYAVEKAQAQLSNAKELMERKKEGLQNRTKSHLEKDMGRKDEKIIEFDRFISPVGDKVPHKYEREDSKIKAHTAEERKKVSNTVHAASSARDGKDTMRTEEGKGYTQPQVPEGTVAWTEAAQLHEVVKNKVIKTKSLRHQSKSHKSGANETDIGAGVEQQEYHMWPKASTVDQKCQEIGGKFKVLKVNCEQIERKDIKIVDPGLVCHKEDQEKSKLAQEAGEWQENNKKTRVTPQPEETDKKPNGVDEFENDYIVIHDQLKQNEVTFRQKLKKVNERAENVIKIKEDPERKVSGMERNASFNSKEYERELKADVKDGEKLREVLGQYAREKLEEEACERQINDGQHVQSCGMGQNKEKWEEATEHEGKAKKSEDCFEQKESNNRSRLDLKQKESKKDQNCACEAEKIEKGSDLIIEERQNTEKQNMASGEVVTEKTPNDDIQQDENERRLSEAWEKKEIWKRSREAQESDDSEKSVELLKEDDVENILSEANVWRNCENNIEDERNDEGFIGQNCVREQLKREVSDKNQEYYTAKEEQKTYNGVNLSQEANTRATTFDVLHKNWETRKLSVSEETESLTMEQKTHKREAEVNDEPVDRSFKSSDIDQNSLQNGRIIDENIAESLCQNDIVGKADEYDIDNIGMHTKKSKGISEIASGTRNAFIKEASKDRLTPPQVVPELVKNERKLRNVLPAQKSTSQNPEVHEIISRKKIVLEEREKQQKLQREKDELLKKIEEEKEREREREKDRMAVDTATREACERAFAETRERAERAAVERATTEVRQRALAEARERLEKASAEARERLSADKASEARLKAERAAVERATAEARERAIEKAKAEKASYESRERVERPVTDKSSAYSRTGGFRQSSSFNDIQNLQHQNVGPSRDLKYSHSSVSDGLEGESAQRCKARLERYQRTAERAAKALAEKNSRDLLAQKEQTERNRLAESLDAEVKRWSSGKKGNLRALLSTLQYILGADSGWQPIPLTDVITAAAVKKAYRKATLCVHPDKLQQRGASIHQKYICEKVFDLLKEAWNKFNSEER